jgi:hypothetical protein
VEEPQRSAGGHSSDQHGRSHGDQPRPPRAFVAPAAVGEARQDRVLVSWDDSPISFPAEQVPELPLELSVVVRRHQ